MPYKRAVLILCVLVSVMACVGISPSTAYACSGGFSLESSYDEIDFIVKGRVVEIDDMGQNGIIHVEQYFKGGQGPEYILVQRNSLNTIQGLLIGRYNPRECVYWEDMLHPGDTAYFILNRNENGGYTDWAGSYKVVGNQVISSGYQQLETELIDTLLEKSGKPPVLPSANTFPFPLHSPILVTTVSGTKYLVPVDGRSPINMELIGTPDENGIYPSFPYTNRRLCTSVGCSIPGRYGPMSFGDEPLMVQPNGEFYAFHVSPTEDMAAFWTKDNLEIRGIWFSDHVTNTRTIGEKANITRKLAEHSAWSNDGRFFAFSDINGLWVWEVHRKNTDPRLLIAAKSQESIAYARYFSPLGRYLAITEGGKNSNIDLVTGERLPDGIVSPNEHLFLQLTPENNANTLEVYELLPYQDTPRVQYELVSSSFTGVKKAEWAGNNRFIALRKEPTIPGGLQIIDVMKDSYYFNVEDYELEYHENNMFSIGMMGIDFDYDPVFNALVVLKDKSTIVINGNERDIHYYLDGDMVSVEWLPSIMYKER